MTPIRAIAAASLCFFASIGSAVAQEGGGPHGGSVTSIVIDPSTPETLFAGTGGGVFKSTNGGTTWTAVNTGLAAAFTTGLAMDPRNPQVLYAGTGLGVSKTVNGGASWTTLNNGLTDTNVQAVAVSPTSSAIVYAGTFTAGLFRSSDGGATWAPANVGLTSTNIQALSIDPAGRVYLGTGDSGVFKSVDGGATWALSSTGITDATIQAVTIDPTTATTLYAGTVDGGVFKSTDSGSTWTASSTGLSRLDVRALAVNRADPNTLYAATFSGMFKSTDQAATWIAVNSGVRVICSFCVPGAFAVAIDPSSSSTVYAGTQSDGALFKSVDGGASWVPASAGLKAGFTGALAIDPSNPSTVYVGTRFAAMFKSTDQGQNWLQSNAGFLTVVVTSLAIDPGAPGTLYAGTNGATIRSVYKSIDGGGTWVNGPVGSTTGVAALAIDPQTTSVVYAGTLGQGVYKTIDGGTSWATVNAGLTDLTVQSLAIDPVIPAIVYAGTLAGGIFKTVDGGAHWNAVNVNLGNLNVMSMAIGAGAPGTLYAGTNGGLFKSVDAGASWTTVGAGIFSPRVIQSVAVDPASPTTVYVTRPGATKVYKSTDGGQTFTNSSTGLPVLPMSLYALAIDPVSPSTIYVATSGAGVFRSRNGGANWQPSDAATTLQPPTGLMASSTLGNVVTLRWQAPNAGPAPTSYVVEGGLSAGQVLGSLSTASTTPAFTFTAPTGAFFVRVHAIAGSARSAASNEIRLFVSAPAIPSAPANLVGLVNGSAVTLAWRNTFAGGSPTSIVLDVTGSLSASLGLGLTDTFSFAGVPNGTYTLRLRASNPSGVSPASQPVTLTFPGGCSGEPLPPSNVLAYKAGSTIFVTWDPAATGPAPTGYRLNVTGAFVGSLTTPARVLSGTVGPGSYGLSVVAANQCGASAGTPVQTVVIP